MRCRGEDTVSPKRIYQHVYSDCDHGEISLPSLAPTPKEAPMSSRLQRSPGNHSEPRELRRTHRECGLEVLFRRGERDLIVGGKHEGAVLTLVKRKTKHCLTCPFEGKGSDELGLNENTNGLIRQYRKVIVLTG